MQLLLSIEKSQKEQGEELTCAYLLTPGYIASVAYALPRHTDQWYASALATRRPTGDSTP